VKKAFVLVPVMLVLVAAAGSKVASVRADLVSQREAMANQWEQVRSVLDRRSELAPPLADIVEIQGHADPSMSRELADARVALAEARIPDAALQANARISHLLWKLMAASENDPKLRSDPKFQRLEDELTDIENSIAVERQKYNEALEHYNAQIQRFPDNIVASLSGFARNDAYFKTEIAGETAPNR
jgi:LemA protein